MNPLAPWSQYFTAEAGAAAALTGLLFVALSFNLERIAADQTWLRRAAAPPAPGFVNSFRNLFARTGHVRLETGVRLLLTLAGSITAAKQDHAPPEATASLP